MQHTARLGLIALMITAPARLCPQQTAGALVPEKYAVLISTEEATEQIDPPSLDQACISSPDQRNNIEFWHDLVLTYCTLTENGFKPDNIFVLYGDGTDFKGSCLPYYKPPYCGGSETDGKPITDFGLTNSSGTVKDNICNVLCCLAKGFPATQNNGECVCGASAGGGLGGFSCTPTKLPQLSDGDFLLVWVKSHGTTAAEDLCQTSLELPNKITETNWKYLKDSELANLLADLAPGRRALMLETCHSGGFLGDLAGNSTVVIAASGDPDSSNNCLGSSYATEYDEYDSATTQIKKVLHGRFSYWINAALRQLEPTGTLVPSDADSNNLVSVGEAYTTTEVQVCADNQQDEPSQDPAIRDDAKIAPCIFIRLPQPSEDTELFGMDHLHDNGTVPSNSEAWFHGPDLWVRNSADGATVHQEPIHGQTNHVYARVHNIGCLPADVSVDFSWVEPTGWAIPLMWNPIGTAAVSSLTMGSSQTVQVPWTDVPLPGSYCLHATLNAVGDPPNADGRAFWDNNKVQVNVSVLAMPAGLFDGWWLWVANWSKESTSVDLSIDPRDLVPGTRVRLELPPDVRLLDLRGADLSLSPDGWSVLELEVPKTTSPLVAGRPSLVRILLPPGARRRAIVSVAMPDGTAVGTAGLLRLEEQVAGEVKGGVDFIARASTLKDAACDLLRTAGPVLDELARRSGHVEAARESGGARRTAARRTKCAYKKALSDLASSAVALEPGIASLLPTETSDFTERYMRAGRNARQASLQKDWPATLEAAREQLLYATIILAELRKR